MMDGIFAGGEYVPNCSKVTLYAYSLNRMNWYWPSGGSFRVDENTSKPNTGNMKHVAPVILAFWSE